MPGILTGPGIGSIGASRDEATWANAVARQTGLDPRVLIAWQRAEGHPGDTGFNYLNLQTETARAVGVPSTRTLAADTAGFSNVQDGITATVREIQALGLTHEAGKSPAQQIAAIAASPWASSHYGGPGGPNLRNDFAALYGPGALGKPALPGTQVSPVPGSSGTGVVGSGSVIGGAISALSFPERAFKFVTSWRFAEVLGGFLLLLVGLYLLGRQFGLSAPTPPAIAAAGDAASSSGANLTNEQQARTYDAGRRAGQRDFAPDTAFSERGRAQGAGRVP